MIVGVRLRSGAGSGPRLWRRADEPQDGETVRVQMLFLFLFLGCPADRLVTLTAADCVPVKTHGWEVTVRCGNILSIRQEFSGEGAYAKPTTRIDLGLDASAVYVYVAEYPKIIISRFSE